MLSHVIGILSLSALLHGAEVPVAFSGGIEDVGARAVHQAGEARADNIDRLRLAQNDQRWRLKIEVWNHQDGVLGTVDQDIEVGGDRPYKATLRDGSATFWIELRYFNDRLLGDVAVSPSSEWTTAFVKLDEPVFQNAYKGEKAAMANYGTSSFSSDARELKVTISFTKP